MPFWSVPVDTFKNRVYTYNLHPNLFIAKLEHSKLQTHKGSQVNIKIGCVK